MVLIDWQMPGIDGIQASKLIKQHPSLAQIRTIVMVSAHGRETVMNQAAKAQLDGFLIKPVGPSVLFNTLLKVTRAVSAIDQTPADERIKSSQVIDAIQGAKVLIVEDNKINQQVASEILSSFGLEVALAENGVEAVDMVLKNPYDLVLMDIQMPEMDGLQASMKIRQRFEIEKLPIIAMTAHAMSGDREKSLAAGMNDHITKPVDPNELAATLSKWIKPRAPVADARNTRPKPAASQSSDDETELPVDLPGTDLGIGIQRLDGNKRLLKKLLLEFHEDYRTTLNTLNTALAQGNLKSVRDVAHTIKGIAGNLGAFKLQHAAAQLERVGDNDSDNLKLLEQFERCFNPLIHSLQEFRDDQRANAAGKTAISPPNPAALTEASDIKPNLVELHDMLRQGRAASFACLSHLKQVLAEAKMQESLSRLEAQIGAYDFDDALLTLTELARNFGIDFAGK